MWLVDIVLFYLIFFFNTTVMFLILAERNHFFFSLSLVCLYVHFGRIPETNMHLQEMQLEAITHYGVQFWIHEIWISSSENNNRI